MSRTVTLLVLCSEWSMYAIARSWAVFPKLVSHCQIEDYSSVQFLPHPNGIQSFLYEHFYFIWIIALWLLVNILDYRVLVLWQKRYINNCDRSFRNCFILSFRRNIHSGAFIINLFCMDCRSIETWQWKEYISWI